VTKTINHVNELFTTEDTEHTEVQSFFVYDLTTVSSVSSVVVRSPVAERFRRAH